MNEFTGPFALGFAAGLLVNGVVRRFISALYEMDGQSIRMTPQTGSALATRLKYTINSEWCARLMNKDPASDRWSDQDRVAIVDAASSVADDWLNEQLDSSESVMKRSDRPGAMLDQHDLLEALDTVSFPFERLRGFGDERVFICDCLANRLLPVLFADNISHDVLNEWFTRQKPRSLSWADDTANIVLEPEEAIARITSRDSDRLYHTAVAIALPSPSPDPVIMDGVLRRTIEALETGGLPRTALAALFRYENDPDPVSTYERVWPSRPVRTLATENHRLDLIRKRTADAGYPDPATKHRTPPRQERDDQNAKPERRQSPGRTSLASPRIDEAKGAAAGYENTFAPKTAEAERLRRQYIGQAMLDAGLTPPEGQEFDDWVREFDEDNPPTIYPAFLYRAERLEREQRARSEREF